MNTLYIIGCGAQKLNRAAPASELYTGPFFRATLQHARRFAHDRDEIRILSARHGLLFLNEEVEPYDVQLGQLDAKNRARLVQCVRHSLRHVDEPLRVIALAGADYVSVLREAVKGTSWEGVAVRTPLAGRKIGNQRSWLFYPPDARCEVHLPALDLTESENNGLRAATRAASLWWTTQLLRDPPPPEPSLFADALALEIWREWPLRYAKARDWPEDTNFPITFQNAPGGLLESAFTAIGLRPVEWLRREWGDRRLTAWMTFSMNCVSVSLGDKTEKVIFQA